MPVSIRKVDGKYSVSTPSQTHAFGTSKRKAERQANLLRAIDHGWKPTGKPARESVVVEAAILAEALLERDDIGSLPIPQSSKAYARLSGGVPALRRKYNLSMRVRRDLADKGKPLGGFKDYDGSAFTAPSRKHLEGMDSNPVSRPLERHRVEKTKLRGGSFGKSVQSKGKTAGPMKFPGNYKVGHAFKA